MFIPISKCVGIFGAQYGDEAKGKLVYEYVDTFSKDESIEKVVCVRFNGGANAGHSIWKNDILYDTHLCPSGILYPTCKNVIANGVCLNLFALIKELSEKVERSAFRNGNKNKF